MKTRPAIKRLEKGNVLEKALVLNSGGCDSTTCVSIAVDRFGRENVATVSFCYGQKHEKELECAEAVAKFYGINHRVVDFTGCGIFNGSRCALLNGSETEIKHESYVEQINRDGKVNTYVPFRNGLFLAAVAAVAMSEFFDSVVHVYIGAHADDAAGNAYADCSADFVEAMGEAIKIGTYGAVILEAPLVDMTKAEVVKTGLSLGTPYELTWSCYEGGEKQCGECGTCRDRKAAFAANGVTDPVDYEV